MGPCTHVAVDGRIFGHSKPRPSLTLGLLFELLGNVSTVVAFAWWVTVAARLFSVLRIWRSLHIWRSDKALQVVLRRQRR